jgi:hypothetical protein
LLVGQKIGEYTFEEYNYAVKVRERRPEMEILTAQTVESIVPIDTEFGYLKFKELSELKVKIEEMISSISNTKNTKVTKYFKHGEQGKEN